MAALTQFGFRDMYLNHRQELYEMIRAGILSFNFCLAMTKHGDFSDDELQNTMLCHPDCTKEFFFLNISNTNTVTRVDVITDAYLMKDLDCINKAISVDPTTTIDDLVNIYNDISLSNTKYLLQMLLRHNTKCNSELKTKIFNATLDIEFIPPEAKEIFIF